MLNIECQASLVPGLCWISICLYIETSTGLMALLLHVPIGSRLNDAGDLCSTFMYVLWTILIAA